MKQFFFSSKSTTLKHFLFSCVQFCSVPGYPSLSSFIQQGSLLPTVLFKGILAFGTSFTDLCVCVCVRARTCACLHMLSHDQPLFQAVE